MRKLTALLLLFTSMTVFAQAEMIRAEVHTQTGIPSKSFKPYEICGIIGFNITDRFFVNIKGERTIALFETGDTKDHYTNETYGINVGYTFLKTGLCNVDTRLGYGDNMQKKKNWKYNYYDAGVYAHIGKSKVKPVIGIGVRHYDSRNSIFKSYTRFFASVGLSFGS